MKTNFTPGPWEAVRFNDDCHIVEVEDSTKWKDAYPHLYIAKIGGWGYAGNGNSSLIAAAPDLYAAADLVLSVFNDFSPNGNIIDIPPLRKALTEALKKARGES